MSQTNRPSRTPRAVRQRRLSLVRVRFRSLLPALLRRAASRRRSRHPLRGRGDEAGAPGRRRSRRRRCRHRPEPHSVLLRPAARAPAHRLGICRKQRRLAQGRAEERRDASAMAPFLGRDARGLRPGLALAREPDAGAARQGDGHAGIGLRPAAAHAGTPRPCSSAPNRSPSGRTSSRPLAPPMRVA